MIVFILYISQNFLDSHSLIKTKTDCDHQHHYQFSSKLVETFLSHCKTWLSDNHEICHVDSIILRLLDNHLIDLLKLAFLDFPKLKISDLMEVYYTCQNTVLWWSSDINCSLAIYISINNTGVNNDILKPFLIGRFMGPSGANRMQVGPMLAPWTLISWMLENISKTNYIVCF